jgi:hypothetical protein
MSSFLTGVILGSSLSNDDGKKYDAASSLSLDTYYECTTKRKCTRKDINNIKYSFNRDKDKINISRQKCDSCLFEFIRYINPDEHINDDPFSVKVYIIS